MKCWVLLAGDQQICKDIADGSELLGTESESNLGSGGAGSKNESKVVLEEICRLTREECATAGCKDPTSLDTFLVTLRARQVQHDRK